MKLYYAPRMASSAVLIAAEELDLDLNLVKVDMATMLLPCGTAFTAVNPKGLIPALELNDGSILTETPAILLLLANLTPEKRLIPDAGSHGQYRLYESLSFISSEIHKFFTLLLWDESVGFKQAVTQHIRSKFAVLETMIGAEPHLVGDRLSIADIYLFINARALHLIGASIEDYPKLAVIVRRVEERPSVARALGRHE